MSEFSSASALSLSPPSGQTVTVGYVTADGDAQGGPDYVRTSGAASFPPGATTATVRVPVVSDPFPEPPETFLLQLTNAANAESKAFKANAANKDSKVTKARKATREKKAIEAKLD